ncbi:MAG: hypothetical protein HQK76_07705 [Desulfobacterales bacterium]|nr:hypothetical protein [Desulfobacterales bacterium]
MEIKDENYSISFNSENSTIICQGVLRLLGSTGYSDIMKLFNDVCDMELLTIVLNLQELQFLNSSGINAISNFVIKVRNKNKSRLTVLGSNQFAWQKKTLYNLQRLMPELTLEIL